MVGHASYPSSILVAEFQASQAYLVRPYLKQTNAETILTLKPNKSLLGSTGQPRVRAAGDCSLVHRFMPALRHQLKLAGA